jgi:hypothetical protein
MIAEVLRGALDLFCAISDLLLDRALDQRGAARARGGEHDGGSAGADHTGS